MKKIHTLAAFLSAFFLHGYHAYADSVSLGNTVTVAQVPNQSGAVLISGNFTKPVTSGDVTLTIKYKDAANNWVSVWCKVFPAGDQYDEQLKAAFELPVSTLSAYDIKMELSAGAALSNWSSITWQSAVNHYRQGDYTAGICDLDENQYTILFTPRKNGTVQYANGMVSGVKDRVRPMHLYKKLDSIVLSVNGTGFIDSTNSNAPYISLSNPNGVSAIVSSQKYIYQGSDASPFEFSYHDPVFLFAGKFPNTGFFINFSNWYLPADQGGETSGRGFLDFTNPNSLLNRYYNLYNYIEEKLPEVIANQEPVVIAISKITGLRIYKADGSYVSLHAINNYGYHNTFGYPKLWEKFRGPGSENFSLKGVSAASLYGVGAIRNHIVNGQPRPLTEVESEIKKFINYVGIFGDTSSYAAAEACTNACVTLKPGAQPDFTPTDWTLAPNSYIFTGKDKDSAAVDGFYIPVAKAYAMWENGGEFMKNEQGNYTPIPAGTETAGLYWEDEHGLIKSVALEGSGKTAKIKVMVNKLKEGNAVVSYRVNGTVYWTWHVWVTDDPGNGSTYHHNFEKDKNGNLVTDWRWMDRNLGATNADFTGHDWHKSGGLQYQWGRKDPFPPLVYKDSRFYEITGEVGAIRHRNAVYSRSSNTIDSQSRQLPVKYRGNLYASDNTGSDLANENVRYSINNPINYILAPLYIYKLGDQVNNNGESYFRQYMDGTTKKWLRRDLTNWFSKQKYKDFHPNAADSNIAWDLWGDIKGGRKTNINTNDSVFREESSRYAMKSPYDPCPCNWRVPSAYATILSASKASPWGKHTGSGDETTFWPDTLNTNYTGIGIYPGLGFDFTHVPDRNIGKIPTNGNYESYPNVVSLGDGATTPSGLFRSFVMSQDHGADGGLQTSTFCSGTTGEPLYGIRGLTFIDDPYNFANHSRIGWYYTDVNSLYGNSTEAAGVRCIKDPNNAYMPAAFETEYVAATAQEYPLDTLLKWTHDANSFIADPAVQNRVVRIPLRKAYAMHKLYLSEDGMFPEGGVKTPAVEWTTNTNLINGMQINTGTVETDTLVITLANGNFGNAVVSLHVGTSGWDDGILKAPLIWSWHIWAPTVDPRLDTTAYTTESVLNNGIISTTTQFVNATHSQGWPVGVPMTTTFMNMDLGALNPAPSTLDYNLIQNSGGLHYQWGRKDPIPVFLRPGGFFLPANRYAIFRQTGINMANNSIVYSGAIDENNYLLNFSREYQTYAATANILTGDSKATRIRKILKYATENPLTYLYHNASASTNMFVKVRDWLSDENNLFMDRWGHANSKSPYDPCPEGWRIPDALSAGSKQENDFEGGLNPWFYNGYQVSPYTAGKYGLSAAWPYYIFDEAYNAANKRYPGKVVMNYNYPATRFVWIFNNPRYAIGNIPNNGIRGGESGNQLAVDVSQGSSRLRHVITGLWLSSPTDYYSGKGAYLRIEPQTGSGQIGRLTPGASSAPQAAMSCRCVKINYDDNGKEKGRYDPDTIQAPQDALQRPSDTFEPETIAGMLKKGSITIFPNPVTNVVYIDAVAGKEYYYQVYNMAGQLVKEGKFVNKQADFSTLQAGAYLVRINNSESVVKIVKL